MILVTCIVSCKKNKDPGSGEVKGTTYLQSNEIFPNPERGFMHTYIVFSEGESLSLPLLQSLRAANVSIFLRVFYFDKFKSSPLSASELKLIQDDFDKTREAGLKIILRFAYSETGDDAPLSIVNQHLDQLKPLLEANKDVIAFMQAGIIGNYGEWHDSSNGLTTLANEKAVLQKILSVLPPDLMVQVRTPAFKQQIFDNTSPVTEANAFSEQGIARVGHHNDCFLTGGTDYGTYTNVLADKQYISNDANYVPTGGETCVPTSGFSPTCEIADAEMRLLKWTYLNLDYYLPTIALWKNNNCFNTFQRNLGYRLAFLNTNLPEQAVNNGSLKLDITMINRGYAPYYNKKNSYIILKNKTTSTYYEFPLTVDLRKCKPNVNVVIDESITLSNVPVGTYSVYLRIADKAPNLKPLMEYAIRLANPDVWVTENGGMNKLAKDLQVVAQ
ncbi:DUF4832 domain-containing protein [Pedobacter sp. SD-b]|uniref:DUF4832 domain-containing protein n=1 Tax=Pedobacter segetis TaxID=2793069 RepID=A0ABS1BLG8_9SPHI|nr:DUF4832 domain-containing protein [Pedobacter segetis]MBK0383648.1 DUF4832 domain-containing protein [Pedobacter segetis]